jgi:hypothetical protein
MLKRIAMLAVTAAVAIVPAAAAEASVNPQPMPLQPCVVKWIKAPTTTTVVGQSPTTNSFDVENQYADDDGSENTIEHPASVEHDDMTYDGC